MPPNRHARSTTAAVGILLASALLPPAGPAAASPAGSAAPATTLVPAVVAVSAADRSAPFDTSRKVWVPPGWTVSVVARPKAPRLIALAPDGSLLVSQPAKGIVTRLIPHGAGSATSTTLVEGLKKPHGLAFDSATLYVAESNRVDSYGYADGKVGTRSTVLDGLPDTGGATLGGAYAHSLKSLAVGPDHALYVSVGSTENTSAYDRRTTPERAAVLRVAQGEHTATAFAHGVRNGTAWRSPPTARCGPP